MEQPLSVVMMVHDDRIDRRVLDEARSLVQSGWKATVIAAPPPRPGDRKDEEAYPEVEIIRVNPYEPLQKAPSPAEFAISACLDWRELFFFADHFYAEAIKHPATVYTAHDLPQLLPALMAGAYHHAYVLYDAHELYPDQTYFIQTNQVNQLIDVENWLAPYADQVITVNKSIAEFMTIRYHIPLPQVILNSPSLHDNLTLPVPRSNVLHAELGIAAHQKILLYQGIYSLSRNLQGVIAAMAKVKNPDVVFVLMGQGLEKENELKTQADKLGLLGKKVFFRAAIDQTQLLQYTASADAGIIPYPYTELNNYYCTPNKLFEFIVAGIPILANDLPELNRFVAQQGIGMNIPFATSDQIAEAIDRFFELDLEPIRDRMSSISSQYTWDTQGQKLIGIYSEMLSRRARFSQPQEEILPPQSLVERYGRKIEPPIAEESNRPETEREAPVAYPSQGFQQADLPVPYALEPYSTIILVGEIKRRIGIRFDRTFARLPIFARIIKGTYRLTIKPLTRLIRKIFLKSSSVTVSAG